MDLQILQRGIFGTPLAFVITLVEIAARSCGGVSLSCLFFIAWAVKPGGVTDVREAAFSCNGCDMLT